MKGRPVSQIRQILQEAFPGDEAVVSAAIRVHLRRQGFVFAADTLAFQNGRPYLTGFALARLPAGGAGMATTVRSRRAYLTLDRPVLHLQDLGGCTILSAEMDNGVRVEFKAR